MVQVRLEHANITVTNLDDTTQWLKAVFDWDLRWKGPSIYDGVSAHVGGKDSYLALYQPSTMPQKGPVSYNTRAGLNHVAVVVDDLDAIEARLKTEGFTPRSHADYEPGRRFYFEDENGIEFEVVQYD
ncbi:MAG: catechol 2,3-dioxygenase-like lactoylglutathione lyase family enzyme [Celeribacter sp.]|jgi:catechol 2,3-dioxygenase-like lactoylglutathione lyase family enzyme